MNNRAQIPNIDLEKIRNWASTWLVTYNSDKTEAMLLPRKTNKIVHPTLFLNYVTIQEEISHKHLGLFFSQCCDWHMHIDCVTETAWARITLLRSYNFIFDRQSLQKLYFTVKRLIPVPEVIKLLHLLAFKIPCSTELSMKF